MKSFFHPLLLVMLLAGLAQCIKKEELTNITLPDWTPSEAAPIVNSTLPVKEIVQSKKVKITEDANGLYSFIYKDTMESTTAAELIQIPDQSGNTGISFTSAEITPFPQGKTITKNSNTSFTMALNNNAHLKYIDLSEGSLPVSISSNFKHDITITITFTSLSKGGIPLTKKYDLKYSGNLPVVINDNSISLTGYHLDLSNGGTTTNQFNYSISCTITSTGNPINTSEVLSVKVGMKSLKFDVLFGDIGQIPFDPYSGEIGIDVFDKTLFGDLYFEQPVLNLTIDNSFGVPVSLTVNSINAVTTDNTVLPLTSSQLKDPVNLNYPSPAKIGQSETTLLTLNKDNSNIREVLNPAPNKITYSVSPATAASGAQDRFVTADSRIKIYIEVDIPLNGRAYVYVLEDTIDINLPESQYVEKAILKLKAVNQLPVDLNLQGYFIDASGQVIDSLVIPPDNIVLSGKLDQAGLVTSPSEKYTEVTVDKQRYSKLSASKRMIIKAALVTTDNATVSVKIYSFYTLNVQLSLLADLKVKLQ